MRHASRWRAASQFARGGIEVEEEPFMSADITKILGALGSERTQTAAHLRYVERVLARDYPDNPIVPLDQPFVDARGVIQNLVLGSFTSSAIISSKVQT